MTPGRETTIQQIHYLSTPEHYQVAPIGTSVAFTVTDGIEDLDLWWTKVGADAWVLNTDDSVPVSFARGGRRRVIQWGTV